MTGPHSTAGKNSTADTADDSSHDALGAEVGSQGGGGLVLAGRSATEESNRFVRFRASRGRRAKRQAPAKSRGRDRPLRRPWLPWSIAMKSMAILLLPTLTIAGFAGMELTDSLSRWRSTSEVHRLTELAGQTTTLSDALQAERGTAARILAGNLAAADAGFEQRTSATDKAAADLGATGDSSVRDAVRNAKRAITSLRSLRETVANGTAEPNQAMASYTSVIDRVLGITDVAPSTTSGGKLTDRLSEVAWFARYVEAGEHEAYVVYIAATNGSFGNEQYREFLTVLTEQEANLRQYSEGAPAADRRYVARRLDLEQQASYRQSRNAAFAAGPSTELGLNADEWSAAAGNRSETADGVLRHLTDNLLDDSSSARTRELGYGIGVLAAAVLLLAASVAIALWIARRMAAQLAELRSDAMTVTQERLPAVIEQLRDADTSGEAIRKVRDALPTLVEPKKNLDEIDEAKQATELLGRVAVEVAIRQAELRIASAAMFVNVGRRSQLLVDRLIRLIDKFEQDEHDPDRLSELFQLDHLVTRMRRNDENLLVLAGAESGQRWTRPAPLRDALRAAAAEIEQYNRVNIGHVVPVELAAHTVSDVVHLVAELLENATMFAPPRTQIAVEARISRGAILIEISDQGAGIPVERLTELNERLATPHAVAPSASRTMGLYVVAKLAARHGIGVMLQEAEPRGTAAVVSLPATLLHAGDGPEAASETAAISETAGTPELAVPAEPPIESAEPESAWSEASYTPPSDDDAATERLAPDSTPRVLPPVFERPAADIDDTATDAPAAEDTDAATEPEATPDRDQRFAKRSHKHWRYGELAENETPADVTLAIFESIESEWFKETPDPAATAVSADDGEETTATEVPATEEPATEAGEAEETTSERDDAEEPATKPKGKRKRGKKAASKSDKKVAAEEPTAKAATENPETATELDEGAAAPSADVVDAASTTAAEEPTELAEPTEAAEDTSAVAPVDEPDTTPLAVSDEPPMDRAPTTMSEEAEAVVEATAEAEPTADDEPPTEVTDGDATEAGAATDTAVEPSPAAPSEDEPEETAPPSEAVADAAIEAATALDDQPGTDEAAETEEAAEHLTETEPPKAAAPEPEAVETTEPPPLLPPKPKGQTARVIHPVVVDTPAHTAIRGRFPLPTITSTPPRHPSRTSSTRPEWHSPSDAGWGRADAAIHPRTGGTTPTGLPKRVPAANYVPGGIGSTPWASTAPIGRSAGATGQLLSRYRAGLEHARHRGDVPATGAAETENPTGL